MSRRSTSCNASGTSSPIDVASQYSALEHAPNPELAVIGVLPKKNEIRAVEEFFQLFKTPWELFRPGEAYDVVLVTGDEPPELDARLVLIYRSEVTRIDRAAHLSPQARRQNVRVDYRGRQFPLYGELLTFDKAGQRVICTTSGGEAVGIEASLGTAKVVRIGYDLFEEIAFLLTAGQPVEHARIPTLDLHIAMVRDLVVEAGISLLEISPAPAGHDFAVCLTHDIDFAGIRRHKFDHTMWGFLYRATVGAARDVIRRRASVIHLLRSWKAAASLPLVYLGWVKDFWMCFDWYLRLEQGLRATYFFIPFKHRRGDRVAVSHPERRATAYDVGDVSDWTARLLAAGCEIGVHGIDAWHSADKGREELERITAVTGHPKAGIRMHWLLHDENTHQVLEEAGYTYDSTAGYNETPGYRSGTTQVFRPLTARHLLELPLHVQDGALFYPGRLNLSEEEAWKQCETFIANAEQLGGVLTVLWHDRSPGPERFWGDFYAGLVEKLKSRNAWFGTAGQVTSWFRQRREVVFERVEAGDGPSRLRLCGCGKRITPPLKVRIHAANKAVGARSGTSEAFVDFEWNGDTDLELRPAAEAFTHRPAEALPAAVQL